MKENDKNNLQSDTEQPKKRTKYKFNYFQKKRFSFFVYALLFVMGTYVVFWEIDYYHQKALDEGNATMESKWTEYLERESIEAKAESIAESMAAEVTRESWESFKESIVDEKSEAMKQKESLAEKESANMSDVDIKPIEPETVPAIEQETVVTFEPETTNKEKNTMHGIETTVARELETTTVSKTTIPKDTTKETTTTQSFDDIFKEIYGENWNYETIPSETETVDWANPDHANLPDIDFGLD